MTLVELICDELKKHIDFDDIMNRTINNIIVCSKPINKPTLIKDAHFCQNDLKFMVSYFTIIIAQNNPLIIADFNEEVAENNTFYKQFAKNAANCIMCILTCILCMSSLVEKIGSKKRIVCRIDLISNTKNEISIGLRNIKDNYNLYCSWNFPTFTVSLKEYKNMSTYRFITTAPGDTNIAEYDKAGLYVTPGDNFAHLGKKLLPEWANICIDMINKYAEDK